MPPQQPYHYDKARCYLRADYSVVTCVEKKGAPEAGCVEQEEYTEIKGFAYMVIVVYAVVVPLALLIVLVTKRREIRGQSKPGELSIALQFLYRAYEPRFYWYEIVEVARRLILVGFIIFVEPGTLIQLFVALTVAISMFAGMLFLRPHRDVSNRFLALVASFMTITTLISCIMLRTPTIVEALKDSAVQRKLWQYLNYDVNWGVTGLFVATSLTLVALAVSAVITYLKSEQTPFVRRVRKDNLGDIGTIVEAPPLDGDRKHVFISYTWQSGQDQCRTIKLKLAEVLLGVEVFLDVDDLKEGRGEDDVVQAQKLLVFLSEGYCTSPNCVRELLTAVEWEIPVIVVYEVEKKHGRVYDQLDVELRFLRNTLNRPPLKDELLDKDDYFKKRVEDTLFGAPRIPWFRVAQFLEVSMLEMVREIKPPEDGYEYTIGKRSSKSLQLPPGRHVIYMSKHNEGAQDRFGEVKRFMREDTRRYPEEVTANLIGAELEQRPTADYRKAIAGVTRAPTSRDKGANFVAAALGRLSYAGAAPRLSSHAGASARPSRASASARPSRASASGHAGASKRPSRASASPQGGGAGVSWRPEPPSPPPSPPEASEAEKPTADEVEQSQVFLLYLDARTWSQDGPKAERRRAKLARDVGTAMKRKMHIVLIHEDDTDEKDGKKLHPAAFQTIMDRTPQTLKRWGLYRKLAVALHGNRHCRRVSAHLILEQIAEALHSEPKEHAPPGDWMSQLDQELGKVEADDEDEEDGRDTGLSDEARKRARAWWRRARKGFGVLIGSEDPEALFEDDPAQAAEVSRLFAKEGEQFVADIDDVDVEDMRFNPLLQELAAQRGTVTDGGSAAAAPPKGDGLGNKRKWISPWKNLGIDLKKEKKRAHMSPSLQQLSKMEKQLDVRDVPEEPDDVPGLAHLMYQASQLEMSRRDPDPPKRQLPATRAAPGEGRRRVSHIAGPAGDARFPSEGPELAEESEPPSAPASKPRAASFAMERQSTRERHDSATSHI